MIPLKVLTLIVSEPAHPSVLVLHSVEKEKDGESRAIPIRIGSAEAIQLGMALDGVKYTRPLTHDLMLDALTNLDAFVESVNIYQMRGQTFFAHLILSNHGRIITLDARPSDAIALALRQNAPVYMTQQVFDQASIELPLRVNDHTQEELAEFKDFVSQLSPDDFEGTEE